MSPIVISMFVMACNQPVETADTGRVAVPWNPDLPPLVDEIGLQRGFTPLRAIIHLHSPLSHDACDGQGYVDGELDEDCLAELRDGICRLSIDVAYLTDHPSYAADLPFEDILLMREDDEPIELGGQVVGSRIHCDGGHDALWLPGIEDDLMPVGLEEHAAPYGEEANALYNRDDAEAIAAMISSGAQVMQNHPEQRDFQELERLQDDGLAGVELYNLHAILDPDERQDIYGLDAFGWVEDIAPFTDDEGTAEPDLLFLAFHQELAPNIQRWDHLAARAPSIGVAGTDAHRNVLPMELRDGERPDGFRRNMRWFSNHLLADDGSASAADQALALGRLYVAFEIFGTPTGLAFWYTDSSGAEYEMGATAPSGGTLHLECPSLSPSSPRDGGALPEISGAIYRDGDLWWEGCGSREITEPGIYRARIDMVPSHLAGFLGDDPEPYLHSFPWVYTNPVRIEE